MSDIDQRQFRDVLGQFPTGVTVVTGLAGERPVGLTIGSFTSVSLDPPLVAFLPTRDSATWVAMREAGVFCANVLAEDQDALCWAFAKSGDDDRFSGLNWHAGKSRAPVIDGCLAHIDCRIEDVHAAGDHDIVVGRVVELAVDDATRGPLLFHGGKLGGLHPLG